MKNFFKTLKKGMLLSGFCSLALGLVLILIPDVIQTTLRFAMGMDASLSVYIEYDSSGNWELAGRVQPTKAGAARLPLRLRRCEHIRLRLSGSGDIRLLSLTREECRG